MRGKAGKLFWTFFFVLLSLGMGAAWFFLSYQRPQKEVVEESGVPPALVFAVMKAESGFREDAVSGAGAVGLMQLMPATAEFVCRMRGMSFSSERLKEGEYNAELGCAYLAYLLERFQNEQTAVAAYNAGEGTVALWLKEAEYSADGRSLTEIPFPETRAYLKKVGKFRKIYEIFYR